MLEVLFEALFEFILQIVGELIADAIGLGLKKVISGPVLGAIWYTLLGAGCGFLSILIWPTSFLDSKTARVTNLVVSPVVSGGIFAAIGTWRVRRGKTPSSLEKFTNGFLFAFSFGLVRFAFAKAGVRSLEG